MVITILFLAVIIITVIIWVKLRFFYCDHIFLIVSEGDGMGDMYKCIKCGRQTMNLEEVWEYNVRR